jgi:tRNA nucleotidyltransferase (CCA-adding enzyme)
MDSAGKPIESLTTALWRAHPELATIRDAATEPVYVVGGAVRDLLAGLGRADLDVVVEGDAAALAARLGAEPQQHERFATAKVEFDGHEVDIASARSESYPHPGSLPEVSPAATIEADLGRRDFSVNAMAIPLAGPPRLIDPHGGRADLEAGLLRALHPESFADDPTRAIRAARYAARLGLEPEPETAALLRATDLETVSADRRRAELLRLAGEASAPRGFALLREWGLLASRGEEDHLVERVAELAAAAPWAERLGPSDRARALLAAALGPAGGERELAAARPQRPSRAVELARGHDPVELVLARALGAAWLDRYLRDWSKVTLAIDGGDLLAAGVPEGPALGRGLSAALQAKLDGEISTPAQELATALAAARDRGGRRA